MDDKVLISRLYQKMSLIRHVEYRIAELYPTDVIKSPIHLSVGQESIAVGLCDPLNTDDIVSNTYRCHATYIAKGGNLKAMFAELFGKRTGCAGGRAGSMHLIDMERGVLGASAVVGTTVPIATGYALALQRKAQQIGEPRIVACVFGDGCTEEGVTMESINFAALHQLPIIYLCENNGLAIHTPIEKRWASTTLCERIATYGIPVYKLEDQNIFELHEIVTNIAHDLRHYQTGPVFIECMTYRWLEHVGPNDDHNEAYRDPVEFAFWRDRDQLSRLASMLDPNEVKQIDAVNHALIAEAEQFAKESPYPSKEELYDHVYAGVSDIPRCENKRAEGVV